MTCQTVDAEFDFAVDEDAVERRPHFLEDLEDGGRDGLHHIQFRLADAPSADDEIGGQNLLVRVHGVVLGVVLSQHFNEKNVNSTSIWWQVKVTTLKKVSCLIGVNLKPSLTAGFRLRKDPVAMRLLTHSMGTMEHLRATNDVSSPRPMK